MPTENLRERIDYLDIFRSFGIILMVMGHIGFGYKFDFFIHAFHMPMFFWISGFLYKQRNEYSLKNLVIKKAKALLIPYLVFGLGNFVLDAIISCIKHTEINFGFLIHLFTVNTEGLNNCGALWFLTALFITNIIFFIIDRYIQNSMLKVLAVVSVALFGNVAERVLPITLPLAMSAGFVGVGLYYSGFLFRKYNDKKYIHSIMNLSWISNIILGAVTTVLIFLNGYINMREGTYGIVPLFWINAILSIIVGLNFARLIHRHIEKSLIGQWLRGIGSDSVVYLCTNQIVIIAANDITYAMNLMAIAAKLSILLLTFVILFIVSRIIAHTRLKVLIGRL